MFHFCIELHFLPSNLHLYSNKICFGSVLDSFIKYFQVHVFHFVRNTYSTKWILDIIAVPITSVHANNEWTVIKFIKIQINKRWPNHALLIIHGYKLYG